MLKLSPYIRLNAMWEFKISVTQAVWIFRWLILMNIWEAFCRSALDQSHFSIFSEILFFINSHQLFCQFLHYFSIVIWLLILKNSQFFNYLISGHQILKFGKKDCMWLIFLVWIQNVVLVLICAYLWISINYLKLKYLFKAI